MARISAFRSDDTRTAYCDLYDATLAGSPIPLTESDVGTSFGRAHVLTAGDPDKPALVAFHGMAFSSTSWLPQLPTFTANHSVTLIDAIGDVNKSVAHKPITDATHVVAWVDEVLSALKIQRVAMIGLSMGAWMAAQYAMAFPSRVERLALIAPVGLVIGQRPVWMVRGYYANYVRPTKARLQTFIESTVTPTARPLLRQDPWRSIIQQYVEGREESLHDGAKAAGRYRRQLPEARVELVDGANHVIPVDQPRIVDELLDEFLG
jgi:pimeloyl-ACP methyl ester carboxylesterase